MVRGHQTKRLFRRMQHIARPGRHPFCFAHILSKYIMQMVAGTGGLNHQVLTGPGHQNMPEASHDVNLCALSSNSTDESLRM